MEAAFFSSAASYGVLLSEVVDLRRLKRGFKDEMVKHFF
jgi:hypothetical protein